MEDEFPRRVVARIIKDGLPPGVGVAKDVKAAIGFASKVFVSYMTAMAQALASEQGRKVITADDVLSALDEMEFSEFKPELQATLDVYRGEQEEKKQRRKAAQAEKQIKIAKEAESAEGIEGIEQQSVEGNAMATETDDEAGQAVKDGGDGEEQDEQEEEVEKDDAEEDEEE
eukprot:m.123767 g.123767  ORF g.123767 m.123767 type:complete len:172 (+) comp13759_c0_seq1:171-686(+)